MCPTIVLVHGAFADSSSWDRVIELLPTEQRVIAAANPLRSIASDAESVSDLVRSIDGPVAHTSAARQERPSAFRAASATYLAQARTH
jgi:pimeloyl-ACP methyl ester carboxylesterase